MIHTEVSMKELGRGNKRLQHNIVDLYPGLPTQTDEAFKVDGRKHTRTHTHTHTHSSNRFYLTFPSDNS